MNIFKTSLCILLYTAFSTTTVFAQVNSPNGQTRYIVPAVIHNRDTIPFVELEEVAVYSPTLGDSSATKEYAKLKKTVIKMRPYAQKATALLAEVEEQTAQMDKRRDQKKYINTLEKRMKDQFMDELRNFSTYQGKVLMKMVERETGEPFFETVKKMKNPLYASGFQLIGKRYGYDLKRGFQPESEPFDHDIDEILRYLEANGDAALGVPTRPNNPKSFVYYDSLPKPEEVIKQRKRQKNSSKDNE